jgi:hypothetical protein
MVAATGNRVTTNCRIQKRGHQDITDYEKKEISQVPYSLPNTFAKAALINSDGKGGHY